MAPKERILVVEHDPDAGDLIVRQTLKPLGFHVRWVQEASTAIQQAIEFAPHVVIINLDLPGLSGKDLLAALAAQGSQMPIIVTAEAGNEQAIIQAFRLGASDYLPQPIREAEVVSVVERALQQVRARMERETLARRLEQANRELQQRVRELTTMYSIAKAVTSLTDPRALFDKIVEGAVYVTEADLGWLLLRDDANEHQRVYTLVAQRNLPARLAKKLHQPWDDGLSSLVALSGEPLNIHGTPLQRFRVSRMGKAALVVPITAKDQTIGLLTVMRKASKPFTQSNQTLLEAVADYATIAIMNLKLFQALEERAQSLQTLVEKTRENERLKTQILQNISHELRTPLVTVKGYVDLLVDGQMGTLQPEQHQALVKAQRKLDEMVEAIQAITMLQDTTIRPQSKTVDLNLLIQKAAEDFQEQAKQAKVALHLKLPATPILVQADPSQMLHVLRHLISNGVKFTPEGGKVTVSAKALDGHLAQVTVQDTGIGIPPEHIEHIFKPFYQVNGSTTRRYGGLGVGLALVREVVRAHGGEVSVKSQPNQGSVFSFTVPRA